MGPDEPFDSRGAWRVARGPGEEEGPARSFRDLRVWQAALAWAEEVYRASASWPRDERFGLTSQVRRAAVSVASNIAEGAARKGTREFLNFLSIARGSLAEAETQLILSHRLGFLSDIAHQKLAVGADDISRMLAGLIASLKHRE